jgi:KIP1-like protein
MIKIIEGDADSFALRAEMYYERRPEVMSLLEDIYRAYRALAERHDHAIGALRQAHRTMVDAFHNQVNLEFHDDDADDYVSCDADGDDNVPPLYNTAVLQKQINGGHLLMSYHGVPTCRFFYQGI